MRTFKVTSAPTEGQLHRINVSIKANAPYEDFIVLNSLTSDEVNNLMAVLGNAYKTMRAIEQSPSLRASR